VPDRDELPYDEPDEPDRDDGAEEDDDGEEGADETGEDDDFAAGRGAAEEAVFGAAGAAGAAADEAGPDGVNDGVRSRGVKTESPPRPEASRLAGDEEDEEEEDEDEDEAPLALPIPSAGSGTAVPAAVSVSAASAVSSVDFPLAPVTGAVPVRVALAPVDPERELPVLVRDDDMELFSMTASVSATSVSSSLTCGAVMNGVCVLDPASSTPSSSVPTGAPLYLA
jgi:hypothetical protein